MEVTNDLWFTTNSLDDVVNRFFGLVLVHNRFVKPISYTTHQAESCFQAYRNMDMQIRFVMDRTQVFVQVAPNITAVTEADWFSIEHIAAFLGQPRLDAIEDPASFEEYMTLVSAYFQDHYRKIATILDRNSWAFTKQQLHTFLEEEFRKRVEAIQTRDHR